MSLAGLLEICRQLTSKAFITAPLKYFTSYSSLRWCVVPLVFSCLGLSLEQDFYRSWFVFLRFLPWKVEWSRPSFIDIGAPQWPNFYLLLSLTIVFYSCKWILNNKVYRYKVKSIRDWITNKLWQFTSQIFRFLH